MDVFAAVLRGLLGIVVLLGLAVLWSESRRRIDWKLVGGGLLLQFAIAMLVLRAPGAAGVFRWLSSGFVAVLDSTTAGSTIVFGALGDSEILRKYMEPDHVVLAFQGLTVIIFFSALTSLFYYLGVLQWFVRAFAALMNRMMRLSGPESLAAAGNVFLGQTESPLLVKPYIDRMTRSEIMALMTGGMATIAGSVMGLYIRFLGGDDPAGQREFATFLLCASLMNAPASLVMAKILVPQTAETCKDTRIDRSECGANLLDAITRGTSQGLRLALNVAAMLIAFIALVTLVNKGLFAVGRAGEGDWIAEAVRRLSGGVFSELSLEAVFGFLYAPVAWVIGVPAADVLEVGQLMGKKMVINEFVAYQDLSAYQSAGALDRKSVFLATFALCGFANFGSIGIQIGGISVLAPDRRSELCQLGFKAMVGGMLASLSSAALAGMLAG